MHRSIALALCLAVLSACAHTSVADQPVSVAPRSLDEIAREYVRLQLAIGERDPGYVDAYYGPADLATAAKADKRSPAELARAISANRAALADIRMRARGDAMWLRRVESLDAQMIAAETRLRVLQGEKLSFRDEARGLYGVDVDLAPLSSFDPILAEMDRLLPGEGPLWERLERLATSTEIKKDRLQPVFERAIAECRARTQAHIDLPAGESFALEFVTGKSWSGYNWYQGGLRSLIQVNTDLPIRADRALDLGCHEGYPGHHALNSLLEQRLTKERGWIEFSLYPLYSPLSLIAEGTANFGIVLAFPGAEKAAVERSVIYPLAGLDPALAETVDRVGALSRRLNHSRNTIAAEYLDGRLSRAEAVAALQTYTPASPARAEQQMKFIETYRSYVINYNLGRDLVEAWIDRTAGTDPAARWAAFERVISQPTLPRHLIER